MLELLARQQGSRAAGVELVARQAQLSRARAAVLVAQVKYQLLLGLRTLAEAAAVLQTVLTLPQVVLAAVVKAAQPRVRQLELLELPTRAVVVVAGQRTFQAATVVLAWLF
jgi:hypothetical protein